MPRYINADEIENVKFQEENLRGMGEHIAYRVGWNEAVESILENAPSIEIIRCHECKHCEYDGNEKLYRCTLIKHHMYHAEKHFCSYGCRDSEKPNNSKVSEIPTGSTASKMEQVGKE